MKLVLGTLLALSPLMANANYLNCKNSQDYLNNGWNVHNPKKFERIYKRTQKLIDRNIASGDFVDDLQGTTRTYQGLGGKPILMKVQTYDSLNTPTDEMYGDYAIMRNHFSQAEVLEVRWYDGVQRNVVFNPKYMSCVSTIQPFAYNTIF